MHDLVSRTVLIVLTYYSLSLSSIKAANYTGRLNCTNLEPLYNALNDGRASAFCQGAALICKALSFRETLPQNSELRGETDFLEQQRDHALAICEVGIFGYNREYYLNNLDRKEKKRPQKKPQ